MKKIMGAVLAAALFLAAAYPATAGAATADSAAEAGSAEDIIRALGIMVGDEKGDMDLGGGVTRAQFCKMMTVASVHKDSAGSASGYSMFRDLRSSHWAYGYVTVAVNNGWFMGYVDGTFKPDDPIKLEEAATALLRLLGYDKTDVPGAYPAAQLGKAGGLGLLADVTAQKGDELSRRDALRLFYNLLTAKTKQGETYAATLGYKLDGAGKLDYAGIVASGTQGPFVLKRGGYVAAALPFTETNISVYRNGRPADGLNAESYDVFYYNANIRSVWLYSSRVTGVLSAVSPGTAAPESVTVDGRSYNIGVSSAAYKVSSSGALRVGDTVTLLLGMDDAVADIIPASELSGTYYGVVIGRTPSVYTDGDGKAVAGYTLTVACTDGVERTFSASGASADVGHVVEGGYTDSRLAAKLITSTSAGGAVNKDATAMGETPFADDIEILDADTRGGYAVLQPSRLSGVTLSRDRIRLCILNTNGEISRLILNNVTGDLYSYVLLTGVSESVSSGSAMSVSGTYSYLADGKPGSVSGSAVYFLKHGGAVLQYDSNGGISGIKNLTEITPSSVGSDTLIAGGKTYELGDGVQVYIRSGTEYYYASGPEDVSDTGRYTLRAWYDELGAPAGGRVRVILATENRRG
jgi:hypothetical protein